MINKKWDIVLKEEMQKDSQIYKEISNKIQKQIENIEFDCSLLKNWIEQ